MRGKEWIFAVVVMLAAAKFMFRFRGPGGPDDATRARQWRDEPAPAAAPVDAATPPHRSEPIRMPTHGGVDITAGAFEDKCQWLAVKTAKPETVAKLLKLRHLTRSNWKDGVDAAFENDDKVFVTASIGGWVLALDPNFTSFENVFDKPETIGRWSKAVRAPVQVFISDRRSGTYGWIKAAGGKVNRMFMEVEGKVVANVGPETTDEKELRAAVRAEWSGVRSDMEALLPRLAARWSLDPNALDRRLEPIPMGLLGEPPPL